MYSTLLRANIHPCIDNSQKNSPDSTDACYSHPKNTERMYLSTRKMFLRWQGFFGDLPLIATSVCLPLGRTAEYFSVNPAWELECLSVDTCGTLPQKCKGFACHLMLTRTSAASNMHHCYTLSTPYKVCGRYQAVRERDVRIHLFRSAWLLVMTMLYCLGGSHVRKCSGN